VPGELSAAVNDESADLTERAVGAESADMPERAVQRESAATRERAERKESAENRERAASLECAVIAERAAAMESAAKGERAVDHQEIRRRLAELDRAVDNDETKLDKTLRLQRLVRGYLKPAGSTESTEVAERAAEAEGAVSRERAGLSESTVTPEQ
jgi:hypothetical protein